MCHQYGISALVPQMPFRGGEEKNRPPILDWVENGLLSSRPKVISPKMFSQVARNAKLNVA